MFCQGLQRWVTSIGSLTRNLKRTTARLNEHLKFNKTSLREAIGDLINQAEFAQYYLQVNGSQEVTEVNTYCRSVVRKPGSMDTLVKRGENCNMGADKMVVATKSLYFPVGGEVF